MIRLCVVTLLDSGDVTTRPVNEAEPKMTLKIVSLKVDPMMKVQADTVLNSLGVSFSEFMRMALIHLIERGELPFDRIDSGVRVGRRQTAQSVTN